MSNVLWSGDPFGGTALAKLFPGKARECPCKSLGMEAMPSVRGGSEEMASVSGQQSRREAFWKLRARGPPHRWGRSFQL